MKKTLTLFIVLFLTTTAIFALPSFDDSQRAKADGYDWGFYIGNSEIQMYALNSDKKKGKEDAYKAAVEFGYIDDGLKMAFFVGAGLGYFDFRRFESMNAPSINTYKNPFREYIVTKELQTAK